MNMIICLSLMIGFTFALMPLARIHPLYEKPNMKKAKNNLKEILKGYLLKENSKEANRSTEVENREVPDLRREKNLHLKKIG